VTNLQLPDPDRDPNPEYTYNKITTSVVQRSDGWHVVLKKWHDQTGVERIEESAMRWMTEGAASDVATKLAHQMRQRIENSHAGRGPGR